MNETERKVIRDFNAIKDDLARWGKYVDGAIVSILRQNNFKIKILPEFRIKEDKSLLAKALYRGKDYPDPIKKIEDKVATRVVLLTTDDVNAARKLFLETRLWSAKITNDYVTFMDKFPELFTYQSVHIVVSPLPSNEEFGDKTDLLTCEIQIRTLLQHAYAEISHDSTYKGPFKNDNEIIRELAKTMALMEATDEYFCDIFKKLSDEKRRYTSFLKALIKIYTTIKNDFDENSVDYEVTKIAFSLIEKNETNISDIETFSARHRQDLINVITNPGFLFTQPIIILLSFYFFQHKSFLRSNWPFSEESLRSLFQAYNTSFGSY